MKDALFRRTAMSKGFTIGVILFALLAYTGIYNLVIDNVPTGRLLLELSMVPGYIAILCEGLVAYANWKAKQNLPRCLG
jgi:hypothetical protein